MKIYSAAFGIALLLGLANGCADDDGTVCTVTWYDVEGGNVLATAEIDYPDVNDVTEASNACLADQDGLAENPGDASTYHDCNCSTL